MTSAPRPNTKPIQSVCVLGGGTAGFLAALTLERRLPHLQIQLIRSPGIPVTGVGESSLVSLPRFVHNILGIDRESFYREVRPVWKLGVKLIWGPPNVPYFLYPFGGSYLELRHKRLPRDNAYYCLVDGLQPASLYCALMEQRKAPVLRDESGRIGFVHQYGYHIENRAFIRLLEQVARQRDIRIVDREVVDVQLDDGGNIAVLHIDGDEEVTADLYLDSSGFSSRLLGQALDEPFVSFASSLCNDRAVIGAWNRSGSIQPYTSAETMENGWCWQTEFEEHVNRGYVFSSNFCSDETAADEFKRKNPLIDSVRIVRFRTGRFQRFWVRNVAAIGNASGFVEPIQATGIEMIAETSLQLANALVDSDCRPSDRIVQATNARIAARWDDIRAFLATHFKFNLRIDSPYWRYCREKTDLADATELVKLYQEIGPSRLCAAAIPRHSIFGIDGYFCVLIGQKVATQASPQITGDEWSIWHSALKQLRDQADHALAIDEALRMVHDPRWRW